MRKLTRVVFNMWYTDLLQENMKVVPDLDPDPKPVGDLEGNFTSNKIVSKPIVAPTANNNGLGIKKMSAHEIVQIKGSRRDIQVYN